jgi:3-hydroxyacyl-[acyl-carrier protein] dehydratase/trans-2-decenoyl-[acyl-carrier protein] isomerase
MLDRPTKIIGVKSSYDREEVLGIASGEMKLAVMDAKLPMPPMLMMDRIVHVDAVSGEYGKGRMVAELDVNPQLWFFACHFVGDPVMPGCLGLDALWQMVGFFLGWSGNLGIGRALGVGELKFTGQVLPDARLLTYTIDVKRVIRGKLAVCLADGTMACDGNVIYRAKDLKVGMFRQGAGQEA